MRRPEGERLARARAAVRALYGEDPRPAPPAAPSQEPPQRAAIQQALVSVRSLAAGPPLAARLAGSWWRRGLRRLLGRLFRFETVWQHQSNEAVLGALEELSRAVAAQERWLQEQAAAAAAATEGIRAAEGALGATGARLTAAQDAQDRLAAELAGVSRQEAAMERRLQELDQRLREDRTRAAAREREGEQQGERLRATAEQAVRQSDSVRRLLVAAAQRISSLEDGSVRHAQLDKALAALGQAVQRGLADMATLAVRLQAVEQQQELESAALDTVAFMDRFRGSEDEIRRRMQPYIDIFAQGSEPLPGPVLDIGCGRGEFLDLCRRQEIPAGGLEQDPELVRLLRSRGHEVEENDALAALRARPAASLGGIFSAQVIEHLPPGAVLQMVAEAHRVLAPGGLLVLETLNPASLSMFANTFFRDPGHRQPLHPETAAFIVESAGFAEVKVIQHTPVPPEHSLLAVAGDGDEELRAGLNRNIRILNHLLFGPQEYHVMGVRR